MEGLFFVKLAAKYLQRAIIEPLFIENIIFALCFLNLVEFFKFIAIKLLPKRKILAKRLAVDLFIILKWALVTLLWYNNVKSIFVNYVVWYLIFTNIFTYF